MNDEILGDVSVEFPDEEKTFLIQGVVGRLECAAAPPKGEHKSITVIVCHPHPQMGGTMMNKVVHTVARAYRDLGCRTVRFNFRGVGRSEGVYDDAKGEVDDLMAIVAWIVEQFPQDSIVLAGFSFGSYVAAAALQRCVERHISVLKLLVIAPPVSRMPFKSLELKHSPILVIQGDEDEVVDARETVEWVEGLKEKQGREKINLVRLPESGHFFHGKLTELKKILINDAV